MGTVVEFRGPARRLPHIEIFDGIIQSTVHHDGAGRHVDNSDRGRRCFFVDMVEADGTHLGLWDGFAHDTAVLQAERSRREWGLESVVDRVGGAS